MDEGVYSFADGTVYIDLVRECEKCGDYIINVVEAKLGKRESSTESSLLQIDSANKLAKIDGAPIDLTRTEFELLSLLVSNPGRVFSKTEILEAVWPKDSAAGERVVDVDIRNIRAKLDLQAEHIKTKAGYGYYYE